MAARKDCKSMAILTVLVLCCIVWVVNTVDNFQADEAQRAQHECQSNNTKCHPNAYCYGNDASYVCMCAPGWDGDSLVGNGHSGCRRRQLSKSWLATYIIGFILAGLVILWFLVDVIWGCLKMRAIVRNNSQGVLAPQAHYVVPLGPIEAV